MIFGQSHPLGEQNLIDGEQLLKMLGGERVPNVDLTYNLPDHEITLKFKKDILNKQF